MIKDIVVNLSAGAQRDFAGNYAISVADALGAHLAAVAFAYDPMVHPPIRHTVISDLVEAERVASEKAAHAAVGQFDEAARRWNLSAESRVLTASLAGAGDTFGRIARRFDLAIVGQAEPDKVAPEDLIIEAALFESGRPVIVVPYIQKAPLSLDRVMVCWDGGRPAARAIGDALAFLVRAKTVEVVIVASEPAKSDELPGADIGRHLARHGITVEVKRIGPTGIGVADAILSHAADAAIDFIVMGGYGHSRLREFVLGGATRQMLASLTVPTLMAH